jgi:hypothetical protein
MGPVWVECGDVSFPEFRWEDMPLAFLLQFMGSLSLLNSADNRSSRVRFFDGPFWLNLEAAGDGMIRVSDNRDALNVEFLVEIDEQLTLARVLALELVESCRKRGWSEQMDVRRLADFIGSK